MQVFGTYVRETRSKVMTSQKNAIISRVIQKRSWKVYLDMSEGEIDSCTRKVEALRSSAVTYHRSRSPTTEIHQEDYSLLSRKILNLASQDWCHLVSYRSTASTILFNGK